MKVKKFFSVITMLAVLLSFSSTTFAAYEYDENIAPPADNISQIIGDGNTVVFIDVPSNYWAKAQIDYFAKQGIIAGYEDGSFQPEAGVTREEFCKLLVSTFKQALETPTTPTFVDVAENRWSYPYVEVCREFLTGYANPFGGLPTFHPEEYATREDIAVALVRMMGFTDNDANDKNYASRNFYDGNSISPSLMPYVSIACERGLISGYPDGSFGPTQGITRAETVVLLNRATKQAVTNINAELELSANIIYSSDGKTATINISAEEGTTVTVNGETVKMSSNYYDEYEGNYVYKFEEEGSKDFVVEGKRAGKTKTINLTAKYEVGAPKLNITQCPATSEYKTITIKGKATDTNDSQPVVTINGKDVGAYYGSFEKSFTLTEGDNKFTIVATNNLGKSTTVEKTVTFSVGAPEITFTNCPEVTQQRNLSIQGRIKGQNDGAKLYINDQEAYVGYSGDFSKSVTLSEGDNSFVFRAVNSYGKSKSISKTIKYVGEIKAPTLKVDDIASSTAESKITIAGTVNDSLDSKVVVYVNDKKITSGNGNWTADVSLDEGNNDIIVVATNAYGKSTTVVKKITYTAPVSDEQSIE